MHRLLDVVSDAEKPIDYMLINQFPWHYTLCELHD